MDCLGNKCERVASCQAVIWTDEDGVRTLVSYETPVLRVFPDGTMVRLWTGHTNTTWKHIRKAFGLSADQYRALPLGEV